jgi:hypothetical protein
MRIAGSVASVVGFPLAIYQAYQARKEARASKEASLQVKAEVGKSRKDLRLIAQWKGWFG